MTTALPDLPSITGIDLNATLSALNGWLSGWTIGLVNGGMFNGWLSGNTVNIGTL